MKKVKFRFIETENQPLAEPAMKLIDPNDTGGVWQPMYDERTDQYLGKALSAVSAPHRLAEKPWREAMCKLAVRLLLEGMPEKQRQATLCNWLSDALNDVIGDDITEKLDADIRRTIRFLLKEYDAETQDSV